MGTIRGRGRGVGFVVNGKTPPPLSTRTSIDPVFGYATMPRNFRGGGSGSGRSPVIGSHFASANGYGWNAAVSSSSPSRGQSPGQNQIQGRGGSNGSGWIINRGGSSSGGGRGGGAYATYGRAEGQRQQHQVMTSFGGNRVEVVDGLVMNRFQKPVVSTEYNKIYATGGLPQNSVMNSGFYRSPGSVVSIPLSPTSPGGGGRGQRPSSTSASTPTPPPNNKPTSIAISAPILSGGRGGHVSRTPSRDDSFDGDVDIPPTYRGDDVSVDMSYNQHPPAIPENPPFSRKNPPDNKSSLLLSREENQVIFDILGKGRQTLATAVIQLVVPMPDQSRWQVKETGVVCLVRDTTKKSYFIQVFSLGTRSMVFRQEIYNQFEYEVPNHCFLTFEGDSSTVGILFADPTEAGLFREGLDSKLEAKRQRRNEREHRRSRLMSDNNHSYSPSSHGPSQNQSQNQPSHQHHQQSRIQTPPQKQSSISTPTPSMTNGTSTTVSTTYNFPTTTPKSNSKLKSANKGGGKGKGGVKPSLRKEDIGQPMDFRHVQHVGWDPNKGFDLNGVDKDLQSFFMKAGVSSDALKDENTRQFIYNFIEQNGGLESIRNARPAAPPPPSANPNVPPPPIPNRTVVQVQSQGQGQKPAAPPPPPSRPVPPVPYNQGGMVPPPPPPMRTSSSNIVEKSPAPPHQFQSSQNSNGPARPPPPTFSNSPRSGQGASQQSASTNGPIPPPPPPPPPMPMEGGPPPPPPPMGGMSSQNNAPHHNANAHANNRPAEPPVADDRSNLLAQIQKGVQLKKVDATDAPPKRAGGLADCLNQIQTGVALKPVQQMTKEPPTTDAMDGLAGALARALAERSKAINPDSSSEDDEEEVEDDEWD